MNREKRKRYNQEMKLSAFTGWQFFITVSQIFGQKKTPSFLEYSNTLNLLDKDEQQQLEAMKFLKKLQNKQQKEANIKIAQQIAALDSKRKKVK